MHQSDDDGVTAENRCTIPVPDAAGDEIALARRASAGDQAAFDLLFDRYFARTSWYFTIFGRRDAETAVAEVLRELFGSLGEPSDLSLAERAYRLSLAVELRHAVAPAKQVAAAKTDDDPQMPVVGVRS